MKKKTVIIFNDECIETVDEILPLNIGDTFYFALRGTTPRSEEKYKELNESGELMGGAILKSDFIDDTIKQINVHASKYHIKLFIVTKIDRSYERNYHLSIDKPETRFEITIHVIEV